MQSRFSYCESFTQLRAAGLSDGVVFVLDPAKHWPPLEVRAGEWKQPLVRPPAQSHFWSWKTSIQLRVASLLDGDVSALNHVEQ